MNAVERDEATEPLDLLLMRRTVAILLDPDAVAEALPPAGAELNAVTGLLRGQLQLLVPEVERLAGQLPVESVPRYCALACVGEARERLRARPAPRHGGSLGRARRLARTLNALCDHYEALTGP
ncbi:DUF6415 family natural product biosynthesis protein [Streptomyces sp. SCSIO 75703]|uniref:DUF6415 family natural product biosynthesis protein n=1 Tax=unclassified Streptomyces TaxID=2593676 RepID=UPI0006B53C93|nr:DUF6415 family natural product biosynthesis protein [Streptomyces sp. TP-A0875]